MPATTTSILALALVAVACGPATAAAPAPVTPAAPGASPSAFTSPSEWSAPAGPSPAAPTTVTTAVALGTGRRWQDTSLAVAAALPVAATRLGAAARVHLHVEGVDAPGPGAVVVVVLGIEVAAGEARTRRVAVPVVRTADGWQAGTPWDVPTIPHGPVLDEGLAVHGLPIDDAPTLGLALTALTAAGWRDVDLLSLSAATEAWPSVATFTAIDDDGLRVRRIVWLRRDLDQLVVAGLPAPRRAQTVPADPEPKP